jgi:hypothetical protein
MLSEKVNSVGVTLMAPESGFQVVQKQEKPDYFQTLYGFVKNDTINGYDKLGTVTDPGDIAGLMAELMAGALYSKMENQARKDQENPKNSLINRPVAQGGVVPKGEKKQQFILYFDYCCKK